MLAARGRLGSIWGAGREELPASVRFYAGGGGSVRGYGFQELGPLDEDNDPLGGRSVVEFGGEMRIPLRITAVFARENGEWKIAQWHASIGVSNAEAFGEDLTKRVSDAA